MKYMHFNNSCFFAAISEVLSYKGYDVEDTDIFKSVGGPYLLFKDEDGYKSGPSEVQKDKTINRYLNKLNFKITTNEVIKDNVPSFLKENPDSIIGLKSKVGKHAHIFKFERDEYYIFFNMRREDSKESDVLRVSESQLKELSSDINYVGVISKLVNEDTQEKGVENDKYYHCLLKDSLNNLNNLQCDIDSICSKIVNVEEIQLKLNSLFRPVFLTLIDIFTVLGEYEYSDRLRNIQKQFLMILKRDREFRIYDFVDRDELNLIFEKYKNIIEIEKNKFEG